jgi:hypothetical protein
MHNANVVERNFSRVEYKLHRLRLVDLDSDLLPARECVVPRIRIYLREK